MAAVTSSPLFDRVLTVRIPDVSTASSSFVVCPWRGEIIAVHGVLEAAISGANAAVSLEINGSAVSGEALTVVQASSAAGDDFTAYPTAANFVEPGDVIEAITDGASTGTAGFNITLVIRAP